MKLIRETDFLLLGATLLLAAVLHLLARLARTARPS